MSDTTEKTATKTGVERIEAYSKILLAITALLGFLWGIYQYADTNLKQSETRRIEATAPYLERQLKLYTEATQVASQIATSTDQVAIAKATTRFWELYWGELALVEDGDVEFKMKAFGEALLEKIDQETLKSLSLSLAHACRDSLSKSWGVSAWKRPVYQREKK